MAWTHCHSLKGDVQKAINYIIDEEKSAQYCVYGKGCNPHTAKMEWNLKKTRGLNRKKSSSYDDIVGYHFFQSFSPGTVSPEKANELAKEWIEKIVGDDHDYVISTHIDKGHIHTHIIVNPMNNKTGKNISIFYKKDIPRFKSISDEICLKNNLDIINNEIPQKYSKSYFEWLQKKQGNSFKDIVKNTIDDIVPKVKNYEEFKLYLQCLGFDVEDNDTTNEPVNNNEDNTYRFSVNEKLIDSIMETETHYYFRVPQTKDYIYVPKDKAFFTSNNKTLFVNINLDDEFKYLEKDGEYILKKGKDIKSFFDDKTKEKKGRKGLRIKPPNSSSFVRCFRIPPNETGLGYSQEEVIQRIEANGRYVSDPDVLDFISKNYSEEQKHLNKEKLYERLGLKEDYHYSKFQNLSKREKFIYVKMKNINSILNEIRKMNFDNKELIVDMKVRKNELIKNLNEINDLLNKKNKEYEIMIQQEMEGILAISEEDKQLHIETYIAPLIDAQTKFKKEIKKVSEKIEQQNKEEFQNRNR